MDFKTIRRAGQDDEGKDARADLTNEAKARARMEAMKARARASEEGTVVKHQFGETMLDLMEDYFPEEVASRRREDLAKGFAVGLAVGLASRLFWK